MKRRLLLTIGITAASVVLTPVAGFAETLAPAGTSIVGAKCSAPGKGSTGWETKWHKWRGGIITDQWGETSVDPSAAPHGLVRVCWTKYRLPDEGTAGDYYGLTVQTEWEQQAADAFRGTPFVAETVLSIGSDTRDLDNVGYATPSYVSQTDCTKPIPVWAALGPVKVGTEISFCKDYQLKRNVFGIYGANWSSEYAGKINVMETTYYQKVAEGRPPVFDLNFGLPQYSWTEVSPGSGVWRVSENRDWITVANAGAADGSDDTCVCGPGGGGGGPDGPDATHPTGTASVYGVHADGRLTYTAIDVASGNRKHLSTSTKTLGFTPRAIATLNFNTLLITSTAGRLYRVDIDSVSSSTLVFLDPVDLAGGWTHDHLVYDGSNKLFGIAGGTLRRYNISSSKPTASSITSDGTIGSGFTLKTLTSPAPDWIMGTTSAGQLISYKINGIGSWNRYELKSTTWQVMTRLVSPGKGVYYGGTADGAMYRYWDKNPTDGAGGDMQGFSTDPVDRRGWTQILLSAQPNAI